MSKLPADSVLGKNRDEVTEGIRRQRIKTSTPVAYLRQIVG